MSIVTAAVVVTVIGLLGAAILVVAAHFFHVEEDERVGKVLECLPGANCGACGYAGCADYAKAIVAGAPVNKCVPGGAASAQGAAAVMGVEAGEVVKRKAIVACQGSYEHTSDKYAYEGIESCAACAARVEKAVGKVPGVESCYVSLLTNAMGVEGEAAPEAVIRAVEQAGYGASLQSGASTEQVQAAEEARLEDHETPKMKHRLLWSLGFLLVSRVYSFCISASFFASALNFSIGISLLNIL